MMKEVRVVIRDGQAQFIYDDSLVDLLLEGQATVRRASHVEPHHKGGGWLADMRPSGGPVIGARVQFGWSTTASIDRLLDMVDVNGFPTRQEALDAELEWLRVEKGL